MVTSKSLLSFFNPPVRAWFEDNLGKPTRAQTLGWEPISEGKSTLLLAPTGSGKTLAAFLFALDRQMTSDPPDSAKRCRVLYISPLKALAVDIERNLQAPIIGISEAAQRTGFPIRVPAVHIRTGDTPMAERARMARHPPDILITTPESLYLLLTSNARSILASVETVIIDEIHSLVPTKRGAHLFLSLERLEAIRTAVTPLQRIGLSATQRPVEDVARLLGGFDAGKPRPVAIVDAQEPKPLRLAVQVPDPRMGRFDDSDDLPLGSTAGASSIRSVWPEVHTRLVELIRAHRSTMVFVNSRRLAERLAGALNELAGEDIALAHHGSVSREKRTLIEDRLKRGTLPAIVATSSLELGIDMGAVDLVIQIEAPPSVASGLQRIGRACHEVGGTPRGVIIPKHRGDLLACAAATAGMRGGEVEPTFYLRNPLDVLAQQIVATVAATGPLRASDLFALVRQAASFVELPLGAFEGVLDMLAGRYPSDDFAELRPRITWDRIEGTLQARQGAKQLAIANGGTIPDRGLYGVFLPGEGTGATGGKRVGELDEEMVFELREGEVFLLGASSWRAEQITRDRVIVSPAPGEPGKMPFWHGDRPGRSRAFGEAIGALTRTLVRSKAPEKLLKDDHDLDGNAARVLTDYVREQISATGEAPTDRTIVVERFIDELGDWRVCVMSPYGSRVHAPWSIAVTARLQMEHPGEIESVWTDDGMAFRIPAADSPPDPQLFFPPPDEIEAIVTQNLDGTSLFAARFREAAGRALLLPRRSPQRRQPLWATRKRAADLLAATAHHPSFPIMLETYRECLRDVFDIAGVVDILRRVQARKIRVHTADTTTASPFASSLMFSWVASFIYEGDAPLAERRAQALRIDHAQLRQLLGEVELRSLLDLDVLDDVERNLQRFAYPFKHADGLHDLLLGIGDLSLAELQARAVPDADIAAWVKDLVATRRIVRVRIAGDARYIAAEDIGKFRDALGINVPRGLPSAFLERAANPIGELIARYARTHVPFPVDAPARRFGIGVATVETALTQAVHAGTIVKGAFLPNGKSDEFCDAEVLRRLRQKSLAALREEIEPVDAAALTRFLLEWQGLHRRGRGPDALLRAIGQLEGCPLPASALFSDILPARVDGFQPRDLDALCASGEVVWAGVEPVGLRDGRIVLFLTDHETNIAPAPTVGVHANPLAAPIRALLERRGAVFFGEIVRVVGGYPQDLLDTLWDLVWTGEVTNDTLEPLRSALRTSEKKGRAITRRTGPVGSEGRWSLRVARWGDTPTETERRTAHARCLLERYGVVTREAAHAESIPGGFSAVYDVLKAMEEAGRIRRGYFIVGRGAAQFALPGADDHLRSVRDQRDDAPTFIVSAVDPASPYGSLVPWPARAEGLEPTQLQRVGGAKVILYDGILVGYLHRKAEELSTFLPNDEPLRSRSATALAQSLSALVGSGSRKALLLAQIDGLVAAEHPVASHFLQAGFTAGSRGLFRRRTDSERTEHDGPAGSTRTQTW